MPLVRITESTLQKIKNLGVDVKEVDKGEADWNITDKAELTYSEPVELKTLIQFAGAGVDDIPSQTVKYGKPDGLFWLPTAGKSVSDSADESVKINDRGLCAVKVNIKHPWHKYVRAKDKEDPSEGMEIVSDVFGQFPLYTYETKHEETPTMGVQNGLIQLGTLSGSTLIKVMVEAEDYELKVDYCDALGNPEHGDESEEGDYMTIGSG